MWSKNARHVALVTLVALILALALPALAFADNGSDTGRFSVFDSVTVRPGETVNGDVGSIFSSVSIQGKVNGNVFSIFSSISVSGDGEVQGNASSVFSSIEVSGNGVIHGDASTVFSGVNASGSGRVLGKEFSGMADMNWPREMRINIDGGPRAFGVPGVRGGSYLGRVFGGIFSALMLAAVGIVTAVLFPRRVEIIKDTMVHTPWPSLGVGFLGLILSFPLALLLLLTCIGFFIVAIGTFLSTLLGLVALGLWVGQRVMDQTAHNPGTHVTDVLVGTLILGLIMAAVDVVPIVGWFSGLIWFGLASVAFGAVLLSRWGTVPPAAPFARAYPAVVPPAPPAPPQVWAPPMPPAPQEPSAPTVLPTEPEPEPPAPKPEGTDPTSAA